MLLTDRLPHILDGVQQNLVEKQIVDVPVSRILVEIVEPVAYRRQGMRLFTFVRRVVQQLLTGVFWGVVVRLQRHE